MNPLRRWRSLLLFMAITGLAFVVAGRGSWGWYGTLAFGLLAIKGFAAVTGPPPHPVTALVKRVAVAAIVPVYNEDAVALRRCIDALLEEPQVEFIALIEDGSTSQETMDALMSYAGSPGIVIGRQPSNRGKRYGLRSGVMLINQYRPDIEFIMTVDSDTIIRESTVSAIVAELRANPDTAAVTGLVRAYNWDKNLLTRLQDIRYANSFLWERAAYSRVGAVLCVCGSFTLWRKDLLMDYCPKLTDQRFLGRACTYGDDRHLTNLALADGHRIRLAGTAIADTLVPERFGHWIRQQVRWSKSFIRESLWSVVHLPIGPAFWLVCIELFSWFIFTAVLGVAIIAAPLAYGWWAPLLLGVWVLLSSWARSVRWFDTRPEATPRDIVAAVLMAPVYGFVHLILVLPLRIYTLLTLRETSWGTRAKIEVAV